MKRLAAMKTLSLLLLTCSLSAVCLAQDRPNIILVMADDQGYGDTGFTGHPTLKTPHMDAMAENSVVFNRFYASAPVCSPTRAAVMTGRNPVRVNVLNHGHYMRPQETTIAEALKSAGYVTGHFGKWHIGSVQVESPTSPGGVGFDEWLSGLNFFDVDPYLSRNGIYEQIEGQGSVITMDATIEFLNKYKDRGKPMFAVTWFPAPHNPQKEQPLDGIVPYEGSDEGYYREIQLLDQQLGRLRASLREMGISENTIVWYTSDNGGLVSEHSGGREKKGSIYEGGLRVPAMLEWPAKYRAGAVDVPAFSSDIYPTLLAIAEARVEHQPRLDGVDLADIIAGRQTGRPAMGFWHEFAVGQNTASDKLIQTLMLAQQAGEPNPLPERLLKNVNEFPDFPEGHSPGHAAWNQWPWKLHRIQQKDSVTLELYNLVDDPMETTDLSESEADRVLKMQKELEAWQVSVVQSLKGKDYATN